MFIKTTIDLVKTSIQIEEENQPAIMIKMEADKWKHFFVGIVLGLLFHLIAIYLFQLPAVPAFLLAFAGVVVVGYGFELFSLFTGLGHYDIMDAVATVVGGLPGIAVCWFF